ncbi:MAG: sulfatase-like hydrolase/transferase [Woeseiaceae bacterium]|nr:sulfatase-like hydrolase/transferase [Woeseiaceae bacterium]
MTARVLLLALLLTGKTVLAESLPNIVLIVADNQSKSLIGSYGNREIATPNIDRLAAEGMRFDRAFAVNGVCSPTRATLLTGLLPSQTGVHVALPTNYEVDNWSAIEEFRNLPQTLKAAGYQTALIGKYHLGEYREPQLGFDEWITFPGGHTTTFYDQTVIDNGRRYTVSGHLTDFWTEKAIEFIEGHNGDRPFFLLLTYNGPYMLPPTVTMTPNNRFAEYYQRHTPAFPQEPVHPYLRNWAMGRGPSGLMVKEGTTAWTAIGALNNRVAMINTASETAMVDDGVGKVREAIDAAGLGDQTLVIYTADQGAAYGQHGLWGNTSWSFPFAAYNVNMEIPLIFRHPGRIAEGVVNGHTINQVDVLPTLLDYIGLGDLDIENSPGRSFAAMLHGKSIDWDETAYFEFVTVRVIQTPRWKYLKRFPPEDPREFYDLENDPGEMLNLIDSPAHRELVAEFDARLTEYFERHADPQYDLWRGGTAKGRLLEEHYGRDDIFSGRFADWQPPVVKKAIPFRH